MSADHLAIAREGGVLRVTLNRPGKRNALSRALIADLKTCFERHAANAELKLAVLTGAGDASFAAGGDLKDLETVRSREAAKAMAEHAKAALGAIRRFPLPVIAALNGDAMGGGAELAFACDFRVAAAHARLGFLQGRINITTAWGGGVDLLRAVGHGRGLWLLCSGEMVGGARALELGVLDRVAAHGQSLSEALDDFAAPLLRQTAPVLRAFKALALELGDGVARESADRRETALFSDAWVHDDHWRAVEKLMAK